MEEEGEPSGGEISLNVFNLAESETSLGVSLGSDITWKAVLGEDGELRFEPRRVESESTPRLQSRNSRPGDSPAPGEPGDGEDSLPMAPPAPANPLDAEVSHHWAEASTTTYAFPMEDATTAPTGFIPLPPASPPAMVLLPGLGPSSPELLLSTSTSFPQPPTASQPFLHSLPAMVSADTYGSIFGDLGSPDAATVLAATGGVLKQLEAEKARFRSIDAGMTALVGKAMDTPETRYQSAQASISKTLRRRGPSLMLTRQPVARVPLFPRGHAAHPASAPPLPVAAAVALHDDSMAAHVAMMQQSIDRSFDESYQKGLWRPARRSTVARRVEAAIGAVPLPWRDRADAGEELPPEPPAFRPRKRTAVWERLHRVGSLRSSNGGGGDGPLASAPPGDRASSVAPQHVAPRPPHTAGPGSSAAGARGGPRAPPLPARGGARGGAAANSTRYTASSEGGGGSLPPAAAPSRSPAPPPSAPPGRRRAFDRTTTSRREKPGPAGPKQAAPARAGFPRPRGVEAEPEGHDLAGTSGDGSRADGGDGSDVGRGGSEQGKAGPGPAQGPWCRQPAPSGRGALVAGGASGGHHATATAHRVTLGFTLGSGSGGVAGGGGGGGAGPSGGWAPEGTGGWMGGRVRRSTFARPGGEEAAGSSKADGEDSEWQAMVAGPAANSLLSGIKSMMHDIKAASAGISPYLSAYVDHRLARASRAAAGPLLGGRGRTSVHGPAAAASLTTSASCELGEESPRASTGLLPSLHRASPRPGSAGSAQSTLSSRNAPAGSDRGGDRGGGGGGGDGGGGSDAGSQRRGGGPSGLYASLAALAGPNTPATTGDGREASDGARGGSAMPALARRRTGARQSVLMPGGAGLVAAAAPAARVSVVMLERLAIELHPLYQRAMHKAEAQSSAQQDHQPDGEGGTDDEGGRGEDGRPGVRGEGEGEVAQPRPPRRSMRLHVQRPRASLHVSRLAGGSSAVEPGGRALAEAGPRVQAPKASGAEEAEADGSAGTASHCGSGYETTELGGKGGRSGDGAGSPWASPGSPHAGPGLLGGRSGGAEQSTGLRSRPASALPDILDRRPPS